MGYGLGVDLGTSFTGVAIGRHGRTRIVPLSDDPIALTSLTLLRPPGSLLVREADDSVPVVLGGRPYPPVAVLAEALQAVLDSVTTSEGEAPEQVVLTCPAVWGPARRQQFGEVSRRAGLTTVTVTSEPEAAVTAMADLGRLADEDVVLVYDLGGVTVDMTVVRVTASGMEILGLPEGADGAGGADFDDLILAHVDQALGGALSNLDLDDPVAVGVLTGVRAECVRAKEALSRAEVAFVRVVGLAEEVAPVRLTRDELEAMIRGPLRSTLTGLSRVLDSAGVRAADLSAVVLVGGSSRIPLVSRMLAESLDRPVLVDEHPQHCVALGAAVIAGDTSTTADSALRITPGPPLTDGIPTIAVAAALAAAAVPTGVTMPATAPTPIATTTAGAAARSVPAGSTMLASVGAQAGPSSPETPIAGTTRKGAMLGVPSGSALSASAGSGSASSGSPSSGTASSGNGSSGDSSSGNGSSAGGSSSSDAFAFPRTGEIPLDVSSPALSRRAGGHRMPRMGDWRKRAGIQRHGVDDRGWRVIAATVVTVLLLGGGTYAFSPIVTGSGPDPDADTLVVDSPSTTASSSATSGSPTASPTTTVSASPTATASPTTTVTTGPSKPATSSAPAAGSARPTAPGGRDNPGRRPPSTRGVGTPAPTRPVDPPRIERTGTVVGLSGQCLDVQNGLDADGTPVQTFTCNGSPAQVWTAAADGTLRARGKCLQVVDVGAAEPRLQISGCNGNGNQEWIVGSGIIVNPASDACLDVLGENAVDLTPVITSACGGGPGQNWTLNR